MNDEGSSLHGDRVKVVNEEENFYVTFATHTDLDDKIIISNDLNTSWSHWLERQ